MYMLIVFVQGRISYRTNLIMLLDCGKEIQHITLTVSILMNLSTVCTSLGNISFKLLAYISFDPLFILYRFVLLAGPMATFNTNESVHEKPNNLGSDQVRHKSGCTDTNQAVQSQKMVRGGKFWI